MAGNKRHADMWVPVALALLEVLLAGLGVAALASGAGMMTVLLSGGILAATVAAHVRLLSHHAGEVPSPTPAMEPMPQAIEGAVGKDAPRDVSAGTPADDAGTTTQEEEPPGQVARAGKAATSPARPTTRLDLDELSDRIVATGDPIAELRLFVRDIRSRERASKGPAPSPFERFAARMLEEAGLARDDVELPGIRVVRPAASKMFYLRMEAERLPYLAKVRVLAIEAALNAVRLCATYFDDPNARQLDEHYQLIQSLARSICAQSPNLDENVPVIEDERPDSEWAVRLGISTAIESLQLPHRLVANWRVNVADGNVAMELELASEAVFPATMYVEGLGLVPSSREMRRKAAGDYALRLALLLAACAFRCSKSIHHVWVAGIMETATRRDCYLSVDFDRWRFSQLDLTDLGPLDEVYHRFVPRLRLEDGVLRPIGQSFSLDERRFCPTRRYENVDLSCRRLPTDAATSLGTDHVSGLSINEGDKRRLIATDIMRSLTDSTEDNVRAILELAGDDPDPSVRSAAERTVRKLIAGTLSDDPWAVGEEFVEGDELSRAVAGAQEAFVAQRPTDAARILRAALSPLDAVGAYVDTQTVEWRYFPSYVTRALYNRLCATEGRTLMLVPDAYFEAHLLLSAALLAMGEGDEALSHAQRLVTLSPLDARARLHATRCLETLGKLDEAIAMLSDLLICAHDPHALGIGYYRMAFFQWQKGHLLAAQACYQRALSFIPGAMPVITMELTALSLQSPGSLHEGLSADDAEEALNAAGVPIAPTETMASTFLDAARASLDAEVFPVARNFVSILGAFSGDDILMGLIRSIEEEPDL